MPAPRKYPQEVRERAVRMVFEVREQTGNAPGAIARVAQQFGVHREALRGWVRQAEVDGGQRPGTSTADAQRIAELEREVRELRRANEILKSAAFSPGNSTPDRPDSRLHRRPPRPVRRRTDLPGARSRAGDVLRGPQPAALGP
ncbi:MAG: transposase [Nonomuraea sp.]|nr:transposase [Nonomuraea sp.]